MKIAVIIRSVPDTEAKLRISGNDIKREDIEFVVNPYDEYAVEEAVKLKESAGFPVSVYCIGSDSADKALKWALSIGADEAYRISPDGGHSIKELKTAEIFADILKKENYDFIFIGKRSIDYDISSLPFMLGVSLKYKTMPNTISFEYDKDKNEATMKGLVDNSKVIKKGTPPIIISCEKGLNEPRYPSLKNIMKAKKKKINILEIPKEEYENDLIPVCKLSVPAMARKSEMMDGEREEIAKKIVHIISKEIKVL